MNTRVLGLVFLVIGLIFLVIGLNASDSVVDSISEGLTGRYTDKTMWYLLGGAVLALVGAGMSVLSKGLQKG